MTKAAYVVLGVNLEGYKEILGIHVGTNEPSKYWLGILNELKNRGVQNFLLFCVDGLSGFPEALSAAFPMARIQRCLIRYGDINSFEVMDEILYILVADVLGAGADLMHDAALENLLAMKDMWGKQYPCAIRSWEHNWDTLSTFFAFSHLRFAKSTASKGCIGNSVRSPKPNRFSRPT